MKKRVSVLVSGLCILTSLSSIGGTLYYSKTHVGTSQQTAQQTPPSLPNQSNGNQSQGQSNDSSSNSQGQSNNNSSNTEQSNNSSSNSQGQTSDQSSNTDQSNNGSSNSQSQSNNSQGQAPDQSSNNSNNSQSQPNNSQGQAPNQSQSNQSQPSTGMPSAPSSQASLSTIQIVIISVSSLIFMLSLTYLIMSKFGALSLVQTFSGAKPTAIYSIVTATGTVILAVAITLTSNALLFTNSTSSSTQAASSGVITTTTSKSLSNKTVSSTTSDESAILVNNGSELKASGLTIKKSGDTSNTENSEFYGINSGILVEKNSSALIKNSVIKTTANGANAIFSTGEKSEITVKNTKISTTGDSSRGLDATYGGTINAEKVTINTQGQHCAAVATDRGEGTITATSSTLNTNGKGSPCVYSTGNITVSNSKGLATNSSCAVIEGKNSITLNSSKLTSYGLGRTDDGIDNCGVMIYQSMSGDADTGTGTFTSKNSTLSISKKSSAYKSSPMFFITNTNAVINLTNTTLNYGSNKLLTVSGNSGEWGTSGSNGGTVTLNANKQTLTGDITVDNISTATLKLKSSTLTGTINSANSAKAVNVSLDGSSTWNVTGDSYVTKLTLKNNDTSLIKDNGHTIYYDASANSWLNGQTITLSNGGKLTPAN